MLLSCCRICLQNDESGDDQMFPIFDAVGQEDNICDKIKNCTGIKIQQHEQLPSFICKNCLTFLNIAYKFRSICHNSQSYLQEYVELSPSTEHDTPDTTLDCQQAETGHATEDQHQPSPSQHDKMQEFTAEEMGHSNSMTTSPTKRHLIKDSSRLSATHTEDFSEDDYYDECWLEGEESTNQITSVKPGFSARSADKGVLRAAKDKADTNTTSKILGISSDGAAVIEELPFSASLKKSKKVKKHHICDICGNVYDRRYALQAHVRRHRDEKPFECEICSQAFHCNFELSRHIRKHTGVRPFVCEYCKRTFGDRSTLLKHERIHRNERPYACETCGKSFTYSSVLKVHQLTHTGEKPYNCELCGKRFSRSHHLRAHLETLQHQNDPKSKILLKQIKRAEEDVRLAPPILSPA